MRNILIIISLLWAGLLEAQELFVKSEIVQGGSFMAVIYPVKDDTTVRLFLYNNSSKEILDLKSFDYYLYERNVPVKLSFGGISSVLPPGSYKLVAKGSSFTDSYTLEQDIEVLDREFPSTQLRANPQMDKIYNGEINEERVDQSKRLWDALERFTLYGVYETGLFSLPVEGRYSSPYGFERITIFPSGDKSTSIHKGEDIAIEAGTEVSTPGRGRVILAENRIVTGNTVLIEHLPGVISVYYHMESMAVTKGQMLKKGDVLGYVGSTGFSTGPHLHWEMRVSTVPVNPLYFIDNPLIDKTFIMTIIDSTNNKKGG